MRNQEADMVIKNGFVYGEDQCFQKRDLFIENHRFVQNADSGGADVIDAQGLYVLPGLVDVHSHGAVGHDFSDADAGACRDPALRETLRCHGVLPHDDDASTGSVFGGV